MGAGQSTSTSHPEHPPQTALHVLRVAPHSPASQMSIEPFFDFIVGVEGHTNAAGVDDLDALVRSHEQRGQSLNLVVWSAKTRETRCACANLSFLPTFLVSSCLSFPTRPRSTPPFFPTPPLLHAR